LGCRSKKPAISSTEYNLCSIILPNMPYFTPF
jgi:hypothetical protein